jgi:hypothetical protein
MSHSSRIMQARRLRPGVCTVNWVLLVGGLPGVPDSDDLILDSAASG